MVWRKHSSFPITLCGACSCVLALSLSESVTWGTCLILCTWVSFRKMVTVWLRGLNVLISIECQGECLAQRFVMRRLWSFHTWCPRKELLTLLITWTGAQCPWQAHARDEDLTFEVCHNLSGKQLPGVLVLVQTCQQRSSIKQISNYLLALLLLTFAQTKEKEMYPKKTTSNLPPISKSFILILRELRGVWGKMFDYFCHRSSFTFYINYPSRRRHSSVQVQLHYQITNGSDFNMYKNCIC